MTKKQRKRIGRHEAVALRATIFHIKVELDAILRRDFERNLYGLKPQDELRLLVLSQWQDKYHVSLSYILEAVLPYWHKKLGRWSKRKSGLGCKVIHLVGKESERLLKQEIAKDFPDKENITEWQWTRRKEIVELRREEEDDSEELGFKQAAVRKGPLDYPDLESYVAAYKKRVEGHRAGLDKEVRNKRNRRRKYRMNPW